MTKTFLLALSLLVSAAWVQAQSHYPPTGSSQTGTTASGQTTLHGCLQATNGSYTLTDATGMTYQLKGDASKLSAHVGHEVQINGSIVPAPSASSPAGASTAGTQQPTLEVQNMKHISTTCKSADKPSKY
jgi:hypothetical protein